MALNIYFLDYQHPQIVCYVQQFSWLSNRFLGPKPISKIQNVVRVEADGHEGYALEYAHLFNRGEDSGVYDHGCAIGYVFTLHNGEAQAALTTMLRPYLDD